MLDLDKYINNNVEIKVSGQILHVKQPTVAMIEKIECIEENLTEENVRDKRMEVAAIMLNHNEEEKRFSQEDFKEWTQEAVTKFIETMSLLRYEAETDPN